MSLKILFMGTPFFAVPILRAINETKNKVVEVYTQPPRKKNRGQKINFSAIHEYSKSINIKVRHPDKLNTKKEFEYIKNLCPDVVVVVAYGKIIPKNFLNIENIKFINVHASLLPKWRGAAPIQRAIMNLDKKTGVSIMKIAPKLDAGPVLISSELKILSDTNYEDLSNRMSKLGAELILKSLELIKRNKDKYTNQDEKEASYAKKIDKSESKINWNDKAKKIIAKINAFNPNPGCWFSLMGSRIKIIKAKEVTLDGTPGEILDNSFTIGCSENAVKIVELKKEGKQIVNANEFLKGNALKVGYNLNEDDQLSN